MPGKSIIYYRDEFFGKRSLSGTAEGYTGWVISDVSAAGTPTYATVTPSLSGTGELAIAHDATSEVQQVALYWGDVLGMDVGHIINFRTNAKLAAVGASTTAYLGMAVAHNATAASIAGFAWFKIANAAISCEVNNGSTTTTAASGVSITTTVYKKFSIDLSHGLADVRFYGDVGGNLARLCGSTVFDMSALTGGMQPYLRLDKTSGTAVPVLTLDNVEIELKR